MKTTYSDCDGKGKPTQPRTDSEMVKELRDLATHRHSDSYGEQICKDKITAILDRFEKMEGK